MTYEAACLYLESLAPRGWRLGLDRMQELCARAGLDGALGSGAPAFLHVAGTNGKGSVVAFLQSMLASGGFRTGAYFSPFVYDIRERIQVQGELISRDDFARHVEALKGHADSLAETEFGGATEFEVKTAAGFRHWRESRCEWVALEVGLGGRLDATNVVHPAACAIVSIGLDHTHLLGQTYGEIAHEKAGIIKQRVPVVLGEMPDEALETIEREAAERSAPVWRVGREVALEEQAKDLWRVCTPAGSVCDLTPGLLGASAPHNLAVALATAHAAGIALSEDAARAGAAQTRLPGRFQEADWKGRPIVLDGAHNTEAADTLARTLEIRHPGRRVHLVLGMTEGHAPESFLGALSDRVDSVHLAPFDFHRALSVERLARALAAWRPVEHESLRAALDSVCEAASEESVVLVTGSFYLVGEAGRLMELGAEAARR